MVDLLIAGMRAGAEGCLGIWFVGVFCAPRIARGTDRLHA